MNTMVSSLTDSVVCDKPPSRKRDQKSENSSPARLVAFNTATKHDPPNLSASVDICVLFEAPGGSQLFQCTWWRSRQHLGQCNDTVEDDCVQRWPRGKPKAAVGSESWFMRRKGVRSIGGGGDDAILGEIF